MSSENDNDDIYFEPSFFEMPSNDTSIDTSIVYDENDAINLLRQLNEEPFWKKPPILKPCQVRLLYDTARTLSEICREEGVKIWMDGGTLLGAVRHRGLIPWDDDLDFSMKRADRKLFEKRVAPRLAELDYGISDWWYGGYRIYPQASDVQVVDTGTGTVCKYPFADLFFMVEEDDSMVYWHSRARCLWSSGLVCADVEGPVKMYDFGPLSLPGPKSYDGHLRSLYGEDWDRVVYQTRIDHKNPGKYVKMKIRLDKFEALVPLME